MRNLPLSFDCMYCSQKLGVDFAKFCGLLRIYELYITVKLCYQILTLASREHAELLAYVLLSRNRQADLLHCHYYSLMFSA